VRRLRLTQDFFAGLLFVALGAAAVAIARNYPLGTTARMGPGYFPLAVGVLLVIIGAVLAVRGMRFTAEPAQRFAVVPATLVAGAVISFALSIERLGLIASLLAVVVISYLANPRRRVLELLLLTAVLVGSSALIFVYGLKLPFKLWPGAA
jgi:hypothetical protein